MPPFLKFPYAASYVMIATNMVPFLDYSQSYIHVHTCIYTHTDTTTNISKCTYTCVATQVNILTCYIHMIPFGHLWMISKL